MKKIKNGIKFYKIKNKINIDSDKQRDCYYNYFKCC